ncbi:uncharacterized protein LOC122045191 isoform X1 [Zingiber officinale]|uniref:uncharacterized protein LOC122045191 isoform X1 n=1 Tax=Zingiber officinale TaxID=94328 RepID=UPI001C4D87CF|nr:uncharacterized protein LOC122045191 isoform X1 [Zingiber officinale]XP_042461234.1 uncharacterized protein LOC122045191 isoform X1 [Zingiber officinale]XP_042461235.1 uncharacterized protein LOC122045191 isoform X1 [Zingiber officinale]
MEGKSTSCRRLNFDESIEEYSEANQGCGDYEVNVEERADEGYRRSQYRRSIFTTFANTTISGDFLNFKISDCYLSFGQQIKRRTTKISTYWIPIVGYHLLDTAYQIFFLQDIHILDIHRQDIPHLDIHLSDIFQLVIHLRNIPRLVIHLLDIHSLSILVHQLHTTADITGIERKNMVPLEQIGKTWNMVILMLKALTQQMHAMVEQLPCLIVLTG